MSANLQDSVVLVTSNNPKINRFGTAFVIHRGEQSTYLLTCAHVVEDVGGPAAIDIGGLAAQVVASGAPDQLDLAVLQVDNLPDKPALRLRPSGQKDSAVTTAGFQIFGRHYLVRALQGKLGEAVELAVRGQPRRIQAWDLKIEDDYQLQPGYSGSPVVDQGSGLVLGIVSHRQGQGERGLAISVEAVGQIWPDMPANLLSESQPEEDAPQPVAVPVEQNNAPTPGVAEKTQGATDMSRPIEIFFSYAHEDEELRDELAKHLSILKRQGKITAWYDRDITAGSEWAGAIDDHLNSADIVLLLISPDFIASDYCYDVEMMRALERHEAREAIVIPVILRSTNWSGAPFGKLQALPKNARPVTSWTDRDAAFLNIAEGVQKVAEMLASRPAPAPRPAPSPPASPAAPVAAAPQPTTQFNTSTVRKLLKAAFTDEDFTIFCYDNFRDVHDRFGTGMSFTSKIQRLIKYCEVNDAFDRLLKLVEQENPAQYQKFAGQL